MSKRKFSLFSSGTVPSTDWDICFLCLQNSREKLICPSKNTQKDKYLGYKILQKIYCNLNPMDFESLSLNRLVENENSLLDTFISFTFINYYDRYHLQRRLEKLKIFHQIAEDENYAVNSAESSDIKRRRSTRQLNSI